jgi:hypothetical protein
MRIPADLAANLSLGSPSTQSCGISGRMSAELCRTNPPTESNSYKARWTC